MAAGKVTKEIDRLVSKVLAYVSVGVLLKYLSPTRNYSTLRALADSSVIPNIAFVDGAIAAAVGSGASVVTITSNPFTYASGITDTPPTIAIWLIHSETSWEQSQSMPLYNPATGDITTTVDTDADSYVLVVG